MATSSTSGRSLIVRGVMRGDAWGAAVRLPTAGGCRFLAVLQFMLRGAQTTVQMPAEAPWLAENRLIKP